jgi:UDP-N-acetyl-D-glucosamine dehydrogenase
MTKLLENTYRAVNIALVNELAQLCHRMEIDVWDVIEAAATKPFGFQAFYPGIGAGGHCIPVDPHYLAWKAREYEFQLRFVELAADVNMQMATYVVGRIGKLLNEKSLPIKGSKILCIGASFKPGVSDTRNSRALKIIELLIAEGAVVSYFDQNVPSIKLEASTLVSKNMADVVSAEWDSVAVLVNTPNISLSKLDELGVAVFDAVNASGEDSEFRRRL